MKLNNHWIALKSIWLRETKRFLRIWLQTLIPPVITMSLYFMIFGKLIGPRIGSMGGIDYVQFIFPGLIMMSVVMNSYGNVASSFYSAKFQKYIEEMLISPVSTHTIILGYIGGGVVRGILVGALVSMVAYGFINFTVYSWFMVISVLLLTTIFMSIAGLINAIFANSFDDISIVPTFILTPLTYLGGVFYSLSLLPPFWQKIAQFNPLVYIINGFRYAFIGQSDVSVVLVIQFLIIAIAIFYFAAWYLLDRGIGLKT